jgi:hypothetical protein
MTLATVQDNRREDELIRLFNLQPGENNRIGVDAYDVLGNPFELKTTSKGGVSTARDLGPAHIDKWERRFWLIATFKNHTGGAFVFERFFFFSRHHMSGWYEKMRQDFAADISLTDRLMGAVGSSLPINDIERARYLMRRGMSKNDPNIPWGYVQKHGIEISDNHADRLAECVQRFPIDWYPEI